MRLKLLYVLFVNVLLCNSLCFGNPIGKVVLEKTKERILYKSATSLNRKWKITSEVEVGKAPDIFLYDLDKSSETRLTDDNSINFGPVVNNKGQYAYAVSEYSTSKSKVVYNGDILNETEDGCLYKNLVINNKYLIFQQERFYDNRHFLVIRDLCDGEIIRLNIDGYISKMQFGSEKYLIIQYFSSKTFSMDIAICDLETYNLKDLFAQNYDELLYSCRYDYSYTISFVKDIKSNIKLLFNAYYDYYNNQYLNPFAYSNNFLGRFAWNQSYRLEAMVGLYKLTGKDDIKKSIVNVINSLLALNNDFFYLDDKHNFLYSYSAKKYSRSKKEPISFMVQDGMIYRAIMLSIDYLSIENQSILIQRVDSLCDYYEPYYDKEKRHYRFQKGVDFWADGVYVPFNQQNIFALLLLEIYDFTKNVKYKDRAFDLALKFKSEFEFSRNGELRWHYWPSEWYSGWNSIDAMSENIPKKDITNDTLYEDMAHAGLNVEFIVKFHEMFPNQVFTDKEIEGLHKTIEKCVRQDNFSRFMGGDTIYSKPHYRYIPNVHWAKLKNETLNKFFRKLNPVIYPDFDYQLWGKYIEAIDVDKIKNEVIAIENCTYSFSGSVLLKDTCLFDIKNIDKYFVSNGSWIF